MTTTADHTINRIVQHPTNTQTKLLRVYFCCISLTGMLTHQLMAMIALFLLVFLGIDRLDDRRIVSCMIYV